MNSVGQRFCRDKAPSPSLRNAHSRDDGLELVHHLQVRGAELWCVLPALSQHTPLI